MTDVPTYQSGFGNEFATEALPGALPVGRNSPQRAPYGLYAEQLSGTAFTAPRARQPPLLAVPHPAGGDARAVRAHRQRPHRQPLRRRADAAQPAALGPAADARRRRPTSSTAWSRWPATATRSACRLRDPPVRRQPLDDGPLLLRRRRRAADRAAAGPPALRHRARACSTSSRRRSPSIPRGVRFRVELPDGAARGYVCENYGALFRLPDLGADRHQRPRQSARLPDAGRRVRGSRRRLRAGRQVPRATCGARAIDHSPLDVVAWHGNYAPYKYDLRRFNTIGSISFDHPDPSIFLVLQSPSDTPGVDNIDFVIFPPRMAGDAGHVPPAVVPPQRRQRVHGPDPRRLRRQGRRLRARRREPAQLHDAATARTPRRSRRRARADLSKPTYITRHDGVHVRDARR